MTLPRVSTRRLMLLTALVAVVIRLAVQRPSGDEAEFLQILLGAAGLTIVFVSLYFVAWFTVLGCLVISRNVNKARRVRGTGLATVPDHNHNA